MYETTGGIKQMGTQNKSENGRGARVALSIQLTHTHTSYKIVGGKISTVEKEQWLNRIFH
jgi:hypothetical protein